VPHHVTVTSRLYNVHLFTFLFILRLFNDALNSSSSTSYRTPSD